MTINRFFKQIALLVAFLAPLGMVGFWGPIAKAQTSDIGAGGASGIIGLPSAGSHFQNAASKAQSGAFDNPVGGSSLLQENKSALIIVDAPAYTGSSVEPEVSSANVWWVFVLIFIALFSLIGIALVLWVNKYGQSDSQQEVVEEALPEEPEEESLSPDEALLETEESPETDEVEAAEIIAEATDSADIQVVDFEEETPEPPKTSKKRKHGGRPAKKSRK